MRIFSLLFFAATLFGGNQVHSQKFTIKDVTVADLQNTSYEKDSSAEAVILHDIGKLNGHNIEFQRQLRVKILKKSGLEWGNWVFSLPSRGDFRVNVYNLENGQIVREKATPKTIYSEEVLEGYYIFKVFAPNVRVGSIIDIYFTHFGPPREWWFQNRVPVVFNELSLEPTSVFSLSTSQYGFEPIEAVNRYTWRTHDVPAFRMEPFLNDYTNYVTKFSLQLTGFSAVSMGYAYSLDLGSSWKAINNQLLENSRIQDALRGGGYLRDFVTATKEKNLDTRGKVQAVYDYVQANLKWDGTKTIIPSAMLRNNFLETHNGNCADINFTVVALLNDLGVTTDPMLLSTRDNGLVVPFSPNMYKLNYAVAYVRHGDVQMLLDATDPGIMPGILPAFCLNGSGLVLRRDSEEWVGLTASQPSVKRQSLIINLDKDGSAKANVNNTYSGYGYLTWAAGSEELDDSPERMQNKLQKDNPDVKIIKYEVVRNEPAKVNAREQMELDASGLVIDAGTEVLFSPFVLTDLHENPFLSETRKYPVDLNFPMEISSTATITTNGLKVKALPESVRFSLPDQTASFTYMAGAAGNGVQLKMVLKIERQIFTEAEYLDLRRFYGEVVKKAGALVEFTKL
jgi:hypothetical protein